MTRLNRIILCTVAVILAGLVCAIIVFIGNNDELSSQENVLFNVLLTVFSVFISIIVSHFYFDSSRKSSIEEIKKDYQDTTKLYAQKAAEKVDNLSNELIKLSVYLDQDDERDLDPSIHLLVLEEKIRSAIHIIETLKSVNDKSLSDWRGVIPEEEIDEKNEARAERELEFLELLNTYQNISTTTKMNKTTGSSAEHLLQKELSDLSVKIDSLATNIIGTPVRKASSSKTSKVDVDSICPTCGELVHYRQKPSVRSKKRLTCTHCHGPLESRWEINSGFTLTVHTPPDMKRDHQDPLPTPISDDFVDQVRQLLPNQPWPKGTSKRISQELGATSADVKKAVRRLINNGEFFHQVDGKIIDQLPQADLPTTQDMEDQS